MAGPVRCEVEVAASPERVFAAFTEDLGSWWPPEDSWAQTRLEERHGEEGGGYREALASALGWPYMLDRPVKSLA